MAGDRVELRVKSTPANAPGNGFGLVKSTKASVPVDFDPASLLEP
jgi:hypothetical protein